MTQNIQPGEALPVLPDKAWNSMAQGVDDFRDKFRNVPIDTGSIKPKDDERLIYLSAAYSDTTDFPWGSIVEGQSVYSKEYTSQLLIGTAATLNIYDPLLNYYVLLDSASKYNYVVPCRQLGTIWALCRDKLSAPVEGRYGIDPNLASDTYLTLSAGGPYVLDNNNASSQPDPPAGIVANSGLIAVRYVGQDPTVCKIFNECGVTINRGDVVQVSEEYSAYNYYKVCKPTYHGLTHFLVAAETILDDEYGFAYVPWVREKTYMSATIGTTGFRYPMRYGTAAGSVTLIQDPLGPVELTGGSKIYGDIAQYQFKLTGLRGSPIGSNIGGATVKNYMGYTHIFDDTDITPSLVGDGKSTLKLTRTGYDDGEDVFIHLPGMTKFVVNDAVYNVGSLKLNNAAFSVSAYKEITDSDNDRINGSGEISITYTPETTNPLYERIYDSSSIQWWSGTTYPGDGIVVLSDSGDFPTTAAPTTLAPTTLAPTTLAPTTLAPTTLAPTTLAPTTLAPTTLAPTTLAPTTLAPTTLAPTTLAPTTLAPTTLAPTTLAPTTAAPTTSGGLDPSKWYCIKNTQYTGEEPDTPECEAVYLDMIFYSVSLGYSWLDALIDTCDCTEDPVWTCDYYEVTGGPYDTCEDGATACGVLYECN